MEDKNNIPGSAMEETGATEETGVPEEAGATMERERLRQRVVLRKDHAAALYDNARRLSQQAETLCARACRIKQQVARNAQANRSGLATPQTKALQKSDALKQTKALQKSDGLQQAVERLVHSLLRDVLSVVTEGKLQLCATVADLPLPLELLCDPILLTQSDGLGELRRVVRQEAVRIGFPEERWADLVTAAQEAGMNAVVHAGGGTGRPSTNGESTVQVRVEDRGSGIDVEHLPRALLERGYSTAGTLGYGMKMMTIAADRIWILTGPSGTTIVLEQDCTPPRSGWF